MPYKCQTGAIRVEKLKRTYRLGRDAVDKLGLHMRENAKHHRPDWILDSFTTFE